MKLLNAPLRPTPTAFEKKIAPAVKKGERCMELTIWILILLSAAGVVSIH
jgi:hypothetical protein